MTEQRKGWIGVDLDGTLAEYHGWNGQKQSNGGIGAPIPVMLMRVKAWLENGRDVRIMTARVAHDNSGRRMLDSQEQFYWIQQWCKEHIGQVLPITCQKDMMMIELWDDRAIQVIKNTGERVGSVEGIKEVF